MQIIVQGGDLKQSRVVSLKRRKAMAGNLSGRDPEEETTLKKSSRNHEAPLSMLLIGNYTRLWYNSTKACKNDHGVLRSTIPRAQTGLRDVLKAGSSQSGT